MWYKVIIMTNYDKNGHGNYQAKIQETYFKGMFLWIRNFSFLEDPSETPFFILSN